MLRLTASINVHGAFPKIDRLSGRSCPRKRTLQDCDRTRTTRAASHLDSQLQSMCMVRSPKSIAGAVEVALGNAPYGWGGENPPPSTCKRLL